MPRGRIESVDYEARGITRLEGKTVFVDGALPGEVVEYASYRKKPNYELAHLVRVESPSPARVAGAGAGAAVWGSSFLPQAVTARAIRAAARMDLFIVIPLSIKKLAD